MQYKIIYADPPWQYDDKSCHGGAERHYKTMSTDDISKLPINIITDKNSILFIWTTMPMIPDCFKIIKAWGFKYKTCAFVWIKTNPKAGTIFKGVGRWVMCNAELCLLATKGHPQRINKNISQVIISRRREHSRKPDEARNRIIRLMGDIPRLELFARQKIEGWDVWGNEIPTSTQKTLKEGLF